MKVSKDPFLTLYDQIARCSDCKNDLEYGSQLPQEFRFYWKPFRTGEPPFQYIFLAWESPLPGKKDRTTEFPQPGIFSEVLLFAISEYLLQDAANKSFMITNMAKCGLPTGTVCDLTREFRFRTCLQFLRKEIDLSTKNPGRQRFVSIGKSPRDFLTRHAQDYAGTLPTYPVPRVTHYSSSASRHFTVKALDRQEFERFREETRPKFERFLETRGAGVVPVDYRRPFWRTGTLDSELKRLFKWRREMQDIRDSFRNEIDVRT